MKNYKELLAKHGYSLVEVRNYSQPATYRYRGHIEGVYQYRENRDSCVSHIIIPDKGDYSGLWESEVTHFPSHYKLINGSMTLSESFPHGIPNYTPELFEKILEKKKKRETWLRESTKFIGKWVDIITSPEMSQMMDQYNLTLGGSVFRSNHEAAFYWKHPNISDVGSLTLYICGPSSSVMLEHMILLDTRRWIIIELSTYLRWRIISWERLFLAIHDSSNI